MYSFSGIMFSLS